MKCLTMRMKQLTMRIKLWTSAAHAAQPKTIGTVVAVCALLLAGLYPSLAVAQPTHRNGDQEPRRWEAFLHFGFLSGGPAGDIEGAMRIAGLAGEQVCFSTIIGSGCYVTEPTSTGSSSVWLIGVRYTLSPHFGAELLFSRSGLGETRGTGVYFFPGLFGGNEEALALTIDYSDLYAFASLISVQAAKFRFGIGPVLYLANVTPRVGSDERCGVSLSFECVRLTENLRGEAENYTLAGYVVEAGFTLGSRKYLDFRVQYRGVDNVSINYTASYGNSTSERYPEKFYTVSSTEVNFSHWYIGLGAGVRF